MASSIPAALDYLVAEIRSLPEAAAPVVVSDGWPAVRSDSLVAVGINPEEDDTGVTSTYAELSGQMYEDVQIPCILAVRKAGTDAMKLARDAAFELLDAIRDLVQSDRRLGGAVKTGLPARVASWTVSQTSDAREAGEGRACEIRFVIAWQHRG